MAWYRRSSRFMFNAFSRISPSSFISRISGFCQPLKILTLDASNKVLQPSNPKGKRFKLWMQNPRILLLGCGVMTIVYYWNLERVPYTKRSHLVLFSTSVEKSVVEYICQEMFKTEYERIILPPLHPSSIRVQRIGREMVEAAEKGLREEEEEEGLIVGFLKKLRKREYHQIPQFDWEFLVADVPIDNAITYPGGKLVFFTGLLDSCKSDDEVAVLIAHEVGHAIARHGAEHISRIPGLKIFKLFLYWSTNFHLVPAFCKFLAWLPYSLRHSADKVSRLRCPLILKLFLYWKANLWLIPLIPKFFIELPSSRRQEKEADYIGLILLALAGYDPRIAVEYWENKDDDARSWLFGDYLHTHPNRKKRAQLLSQPKVMEKALSLYRAVSMQRGLHIEGQSIE